VRKCTSNRPFLEQIVNQVNCGQAIGQIRSDLDATYIGSMIATLYLHQLAMSYHNHHALPMSDMIDTTIDVLVSGIAGPEWRSPI
jgi:hypothetical protein